MKLIINNMEDAADFIEGQWIIKEEHNGKELVFNCPLKTPITIPDNTTFNTKNGVET